MKIVLISWQATFDVKLKSIKCYDANPKYITNLTCKIFAKRTGSLFKLKGIAKNFSELFYRYTATYRPYLVNLEIQPCTLLKDLSYLKYDKLLRMMYDTINIGFPRILDGCPYVVRNPFRNSCYSIKVIDTTIFFSK